jgi:heptosyltransferase I
MSAPRSICILRLSALGDATHVVPLVRRLRRAWPQTKITWIIGRPEHRLVGAIEGVEFIVYDKRGGMAALRALRSALAGRRFDVLLLAQLALRANVLSLLVRAERRIGFDRRRSRELHGLFVRERIRFRERQHLLAAIASFVEPLGLGVEEPRWDFPIPSEARAFAARTLPDGDPVLIVSPCSSHPLRNWNPAGYAAVAEHAARRHGFRVVLCGGRSAAERAMGDAILAATRAPVLDLIGKDTFPRLFALMERAAVVLTPDSGPMHFANAVGAKVIGLHAATRAWRSGPYSDQRFCVDRYDEAARKFKGRPAEALPWAMHIEYPGVMDLIRTPDVIDAFECYVAARSGGGSPPR